jgi:hypothetical protein
LKLGRAQASRGVIPPHRTGSGPALDYAWEGKPNHEEVDGNDMGMSAGFTSFCVPPAIALFWVDKLSVASKNGLLHGELS